MLYVQLSLPLLASAPGGVVGVVGGVGGLLLLLLLVSSAGPGVVHVCGDVVGLKGALLSNKACASRHPEVGHSFRFKQNKHCNLEKVVYEIFRIYLEF